MLKNKKAFRLEMPFLCNNLFMKLKKNLKILWVLMLKLLLTAVCTCFFILPGILCLLNYAFTELITAESPMLDVKGVFMLSKELAKGHKWTIFLELIFVFSVACIFGGLMLVILLIVDHWLGVPTTYYFVFVPLSIFVGSVIVGMPFFRMTLLKIFNSAKKENILRICH